MSGLLKVFELFNRLTYEQQAEIVEHWMGNAPQQKLDAKPAPKVACLRSKKSTTTFTRNGTPYTPEELSEVDARLAEGKTPLRVAKLMFRTHPNCRTIDAWAKMAHRVKTLGVDYMIRKAQSQEQKQ